jgi:hypothetical protein
VNVTLMGQLAPAARLAPQVFVCVNSALLVPVIVMTFNDSVVLPVFERVIVWVGLLVFTAWLPNVIDGGENDTDD